MKIIKTINEWEDEPKITHHVWLEVEPKVFLEITKIPTKEQADRLIDELTSEEKKTSTYRVKYAERWIKRIAKEFEVIEV